MIGWLDRIRARARHDAARWVVIDTETGGLDPAHDPLLAIGGVAVDADGVRAGDSFEIVLRHEGPADRHNVALHGIGREAQRAGTPCGEALRAFVEWAGSAPRVAFHADFDRAFIERAAREASMDLPRAPWLDLAPLAAALSHEAERNDRRTTLDQWLARYGIACDTRHNAASDALATAELLLRLRADAARQRASSLADLERIARHAKWLGSH